MITNTVDNDMLYTSEILPLISGIKKAEVVRMLKTIRKKFPRDFKHFIVSEQIVDVLKGLDELEEAIEHFEWFLMGLNTELPSITR